MIINDINKIINPYKQQIFFIDMDGVLAKYEPDAYDPHKGPVSNQALYEHEKSHYFRHCKPDKKAIKMLKTISSRKNTKVFILTTISEHIPWACEDKREWLLQHCPFVDTATQLIIATSDKAEIIKAKLRVPRLNHNIILIDDFNRNLELWSKLGGLAVKYINDINNAETGPDIKIKL